MQKWVLILLLLSACVAQPYVQPTPAPEEKVVEKVLVQCWDGSTAESVDKCPAKVEEKEPEALPPAKVVVEQPPEAVPIAKKLLAEAQTKFKGYAYIFEDQMVIVHGNKLRHLFLEVSQLDSRTPITDVFVDLEKHEAIAYCNIEREGKILDEAFD